MITMNDEWKATTCENCTFKVGVHCRKNPATSHQMNSSYPIVAYRIGGGANMVASEGGSASLHSIARVSYKPACSLFEREQSDE